MKRIFTTLMSAVILTGIARAETGALTKVKQNYRNLLIQSAAQDSLMQGLLTIEPEQQVSDQMVVELFQMLPITDQRVNELVSLMAVDGSWTDINYQDTLRSGWDPKNHAERLLQLAKAYANPQCSSYHSSEVEALIHRALAYWFQTKPVCRNWWYNEIGVPRTMGEAFILIEEQLTPQEKASAIEVMEHAKFGMTGQNKVWLAGNVLMRALLQNDADLVREARDIIVSEIITGGTEGIKSDWSYHQHGPVLQFGNYGLAFVRSMSQYYSIFYGTPFAFDQQQRDILTQLIEEGFRWTIWNRRMDIGALGRQFFHNAQLHKGYMLAFSAQVMGLGNFPLQGNSFVGHKHFYDSDYTVHRTPHWMASLKMSSSRVIGSELINEDNLKGKYMGDGTTFYYVTGSEYDNVFPYWQWDRLPGTTSYATPGYEPYTRYIERWESNNTASFVGGITVGNCGLSVMQFSRDGLRANKAYLMTEDYVLCIGNSIFSDSLATVRTTIDQKLQQGDAWILDNGQWQTVTGTTTLQHNDLRLFCDGVGYVVLSQDPCEIRSEQRVGTWHAVMGMYKPTEVESRIFEATLNHGQKPQNAQYLYVVLPNSTQEEVARFNPKTIQVLKNDAEAQVIKSDSAGSGIWVVAFQPITLDVTGASISFDPGIYFLDKDGFIVHQNMK